MNLWGGSQVVFHLTNLLRFNSLNFENKHNLYLQAFLIIQLFFGIMLSISYLLIYYLYFYEFMILLILILNSLDGAHDLSFQLRALLFEFQLESPHFLDNHISRLQVSSLLLLFASITGILCNDRVKWSTRCQKRI